MELNIYIPSYIYDLIITNQQSSMILKKLETLSLDLYNTDTALEHFRNKVAFNTKIRSLVSDKIIDVDITKFSNKEMYMIDDISDISNVLIDIFKVTLGFPMDVSANQISNVLYQNYKNITCCIIPYKIQGDKHTLSYITIKLKTSNSCICSIEHLKKLIVEYVIHQFSFIQ